MSDEKTREKVIIHTSLTGIIANLFLVGFKMAVGFVSGSIAVILDAINNLSDALSSIITIIGIRLAAKKPDAKHPMGYGRVEYLSALIVSALVLYAGITSLIESIKKIIHPDAVDYSLVSLIIIGVSVGREKNLLAIFKDRHMYLFMLLKMIALPAICVVILRFVPMPEKIRQLSMIMMAMPVGTMPLVMLSERGIRSEECSNGIIFT